MLDFSDIFHILFEIGCPQAVLTLQKPGYLRLSMITRSNCYPGDVGATHKLITLSLTNLFSIKVCKRICGNIEYYLFLERDTTFSDWIDSWVEDLELLKWFYVRVLLEMKNIMFYRKCHDGHNPLGYVSEILS